MGRLLIFSIVSCFERQNEWRTTKQIGFCSKKKKYFCSRVEIRHGCVCTLASAIASKIYNLDHVFDLAFSRLICLPRPPFASTDKERPLTRHPCRIISGLTLNHVFRSTDESYVQIPPWEDSRGSLRPRLRWGSPIPVKTLTWLAQKNNCDNYDSLTNPPTILKLESRF